MNSDSIRPLPPLGPGRELSSPLGVVLTPNESHQRNQNRQGKRRQQPKSHFQEPSETAVEPADELADKTADKAADGAATQSDDDCDGHIIDYYT